MGGGSDEPWCVVLLGDDGVGGFGGEAEESGSLWGRCVRAGRGAVELETSSCLMTARGSMRDAPVLGTQSLILGGDRVQSFLT